MSDTEPGVVIYCLVCTIILILFTTSTLLRYRHKSVSREVSIVVWISWTLCLLITYLLPLDLRPNLEDSSAMLPLYETLYWVCFFLTWGLTPFLQMYVISGSFTRKQRIFDALKMNMLFFTVVGIALTVGFFYLILTTNFTASQIQAVAQSFANLWGLSFAIMAMGYGLIEIPRRFWNHSDFDKKLDYLYFVIYQLQNEKEEAYDRLNEWLYCYEKSKALFENEYDIEFNIIQNLIDMPHGYRKDSSKRSEDMPDITESTQQVLDIIESKDESKFTKKQLSKIHFWIKKWNLELELNQKVWFNTIIEVLSLEGVLHTKYDETGKDGSNSRLSSAHRMKKRHKLGSDSPNNSPRELSKENDSNITDELDDGKIENENENLSINIDSGNGNGNGNNGKSNESSINLKLPQQVSSDMLSNVENLSFWKQCYIKYQVYCMPYLYKFFAILLSILTIVVIWSEAASVFNKDLSILALVVHNSTSTNGVIVFGFVMYGYMCVCAIFALFRIRLTREYHFNPGNLTDPKSLLVNAAFMMRFMFPLGYNFLLLCKARDRSSYILLFHDMSNLPIIGDPVNIVLPGLLVVFSLMTWFNMYGKILKLLKVSRFEFGDPQRDEEVAHQIDEGKILVRKFKRELKTNKELRSEFEFELDHFASQSLINFNMNNLKRGNSSPSDTSDKFTKRTHNMSLIKQDALQYAPPKGNRGQSYKHKELETLPLDDLDQN